MAKIEIIDTGEGYALQATFREPFEYFFEIAVHFARFESRYDARVLQYRVQEALRRDREDHGYRSPGFVIKPAHWSYRSSAYRDLMDESCSSTQFFPTSKAALRAAELAD